MKEPSIISMSVEEWINVTPNPHQRNTAARLQNAHHLKVFHPVHACVKAARLPDGSLVKIDGHTRALGWATKKIPWPPGGIVHVQIIPVINIQEAAALYWMEDAPEAVKKAPDFVHGALCALHKEIRSKWVLKTINGALFIIERKRPWHSYVERAIEAWWPEIEWLDQQPPPDVRVQITSVTAGLLLEARKESTAAFLRVLASGGNVIDGMQDAAAALVSTITALAAAGRTQGNANRAMITGITLRALSLWNSDICMKGRLRPLDWEAIRQRVVRLKHEYF